MDESFVLATNNLKSKIIKWRVIAFIAIILTIFVIFSQFSAKKDPVIKGPFIARMEINGVIIDDKERINKLIKIRDNKNAVGLLVSVDSPGGAVIASQDIYNMLQEIKQNKPVVVSMKNFAASGGYLLSLAANQIFAYDTTITGSIGVIFQYFELRTLVERLGITPKTFKSSPLKAAPSMWEKETRENGQVYKDMVYDMYAVFSGLVKENRGFECDHLKKVANGAVFSGTRALELGLIDQLGNEKHAVEWLRGETKKTSTAKEKLQIIDFRYEKEKTLWDKFFAKMHALVDQEHAGYKLMAIMQ